MHLTRPSGGDIPRKAHRVGKGLLVGILLLLALISSVFAWNKAGHMVSGAIAYADLKQTHPQTLEQVIAILKTHPQFETKWKPKLTQSFVAPEDRDLYLFMLAARWPDDIRGDATFHHGAWHYINFPYKPEGQPGSVQTVEPPPENILQAYQMNFDIVRGTAPGDRAVALCWLFHLIGDVHQPLHTVALFSTQFPVPEGDRGGTRFYIRAKPTARTTISLHEFWDDLILGSDRFQSVRNRATELRVQPDHARAQLPELQDTSFAHWARQESFSLAKAHAYRHGMLQGSRDEHNGVALPADYVSTTKPLAERRMVLAGYRLADVLTAIAGASQGTTVRGNKRSKVYHLPSCPGFAAVSPANSATFASEAAAAQAGYRKAGNCP
jgi:S1/P1 Nuclease